MIKWWYAHALTRRGCGSPPPHGLGAVEKPQCVRWARRYHILFSDPDVAWVRDPFGEAWDRSYHLQVARRNERATAVRRAVWLV